MTPWSGKWHPAGGEQFSFFIIVIPNWIGFEVEGDELNTPQPVQVLVFLLMKSFVLQCHSTVWAFGLLHCFPFDVSKDCLCTQWDLKKRRAADDFPYLFVLYVVFLYYYKYYKKDKPKTTSTDFICTSSKENVQNAANISASLW